MEKVDFVLSPQSLKKKKKKKKANVDMAVYFVQIESRQAYG